MTSNIEPLPVGYIGRPEMREAQHQLNVAFNNMADRMIASLDLASAHARFWSDAWKRLPWYKRAWYHLRRPWWALQDWICRSVCNCD